MKRSALITAAALCIGLLALTVNRNEAANAQDSPFDRARQPVCTNGTASGTYAYRLTGSIVGVGPFLTNGFFTHNPDGTMSGRVHQTIGNQQMPNVSWSNGTFKTNSNCTGTGEFFFAALNQTITYNFVVTDGGRQIEVLNTNPGIVLQGYGYRIAEAGRAPSCNNGTVLGTYSVRLDGAIPGTSPIAIIGTLTHSPGSNYNGVLTGADTFAAAGQFIQRQNKGTFTVNSDCTGTGFYKDSIGNDINYFFMVVARI